MKKVEKMFFLFILLIIFTSKILEKWGFIKVTTGEGNIWGSIALFLGLTLYLTVKAFEKSK